MKRNWSVKQTFCKCNRSWLNRRQELYKKVITDQENYLEFMRKQCKQHLMNLTRKHIEENGKISWTINTYTAEQVRAQLRLK